MLLNHAAVLVFLSLTIKPSMLSTWIHELKIPRYYVTSAILNYFMSSSKRL